MNFLNRLKQQISLFVFGQAELTDGSVMKYLDGSIEYFDSQGQTHRADGPAVILRGGRKFWYYHGNLHRDDGPAIETNFFKKWCSEGKLHRLDGPAVVCSNGNKQWFYRDKKIECNSTEEFIRLVNLRMFW